MFASSIATAAKASVSKPGLWSTSELIKAMSSGLGAARLVSHVKSLRLQVHRKPWSKGERQFVREVLPRIAFANPKVNIDVSYFDRVKKNSSVKDASESSSSSTSTSTPTSSSSSSSPATAAAEEASETAEAEAEAAGVTPVEEEDAPKGTGGDVAEGEQKKQMEESTLTIDFANIPSRTLKFGSKDAAAMIQAINEVAGSSDQTGLGEDIPRPIGYDAAAEAAKAAKVAEAKAAEAESQAASEAPEESATEAQETAEDPTATNLMGSAEGLSDVEGVGEVAEKAERKQS